MILQSIQILVSLATDFASIWLVLLHTHAFRVWLVGQRIHYAIRAVLVEMQSLVLVSMHSMVFQSVLILVGLFASNHWTFEWLVFSPFHNVQMPSWIVNAQFIIFIHHHGRRSYIRRHWAQKHFIRADCFQALHPPHDRGFY